MSFSMALLGRYSGVLSQEAEAKLGNSIVSNGVTSKMVKIVEGKIQRGHF